MDGDQKVWSVLIVAALVLFLACARCTSYARSQCEQTRREALKAPDPGRTLVLAEGCKV